MMHVIPVQEKGKRVNLMLDRTVKICLSISLTYTSILETLEVECKALLAGCCNLCSGCHI